MIHKYRFRDLNIVIDVNSGAVHTVSDLAFVMLDTAVPPFDTYEDRLSECYPKEELDLCLEELRELYSMGLLYSEDGCYGSADLISSQLKALCLHVSHDCNLRCGYCFASTGDFGTGRKQMSLETGKAAIDYLIEKSGEQSDLEVDFFGGEPLMNMETVKATVEYAKSKFPAKRFKFTMTTNGILLTDEISDYLNEEMSNIVMSADGRKEVNDRVRKTPGGCGSYNLTVPKFQRLASKRGNREYYVRGTYTKRNLDFSKDVKRLYEAGFANISLEPVQDSFNPELNITEDDLPAIIREYESLAADIIDMEEKGSEVNFFHFMIDFDSGPCVIKRLRGCGAGNDYAAVTPDGDVYPCHRFVGIQPFKMGNVHDGTYDENIRRQFIGANVYTKDECPKCWAKFYCSGGCNANNYISAGSLNKTDRLYCELQKGRLEIAIGMRCG